MGKEIKRSPEEVATINKVVDKKRADSNKAIEVDMDKKDEVPKKMSKKDRKKLLSAYKVQNPVKFESKGFDEELKNL